MHDSDVNKIDGDESNAVLVTGGSGYIGQRLVRKLSDRGPIVVSMYHHRLPESLPNVFPVCSDMSSSELLAAPLRGIKTVVHMAWEGGLVGPTENVSWDPMDCAALPRNIKLLKNLLSAMERAKTQRIVFVSASGASAKATVPFLREKYLAEFFILNSSIPEKVILRSSICCDGEGVSDRFIRSILRVMQFPGIYPVPEKNSFVSPILVDDLVSILSELCFHNMKSHPNVVLEVNGSEKFRVDELFKMVHHYYGKGSKIPLRGFLGRSLLPFFERKSREDPAVPRLSHFLALNSSVPEEKIRENPLAGVLPLSFSKFSECLAVRK